MKYDIAIVGGGMVGLAMAVSLAKSSLKILLVEKQDLKQSLDSKWLESKEVDDEQFDIRVSAISPGNRNFLKKLGAWQFIPSQRQGNYDQMKVWDGDGTGHIEFSAAKIAQPDLGVIVENRMIQLALLKQLDSFGNVECDFGQQVESLNLSDKSIEIELSSGNQHSCSLVIGADGANSKVREMAAIESKQVPYSQIAFVANVKTELPHQNTAWQRFTPYGPVAFLPLANENLCSVVWSLDTDKAKLLEGISTDIFVEKLEQAFESKLGKLTAVSKYAGFPLIKRHSQTYLKQRIALVGDAAHTIHPLAGQGVNIGFQDVACLTELIISLHEQGRDFGVRENLRPFERERKTANLLMQNSMSGFKHLFANQSLPVTLFRNFAMSALDSIPLAKEIIIKKAMGI